MNELVYLEPNNLNAIPFTTSNVIAEHANVKHHAIQQIISKHESDLKEFGIIAFEMRKSGNAGRPETIYHLNEEQATLLITYLKNTAPVRAFKKALVKEFYRMREELMKRKNWRAEMKPIRKSLTDEIRENPDKGEWSYKLYTDLAYKSVLGKNAVQLRKDRGAERFANARDFLSADEMQKVSKAENCISALKSMGFEYDDIKVMVLKRLLHYS